jgi:hypothetical protein
MCQLKFPSKDNKMSRKFRAICDPKKGPTKKKYKEYREIREYGDHVTKFLSFIVPLLL